MIDLYGIVSIPFLKKLSIYRKFSKDEVSSGKSGSRRRGTVKSDFLDGGMSAGKKFLNDEKHSADFSFDKEGLEKAVDWLNQAYEKENEPEE